MNTYFPSRKHRPRFFRPNVIIRHVASWGTAILARWNSFTRRRALQRFEHLNDRALRDIGLWREPGNQVDDWWRINSPP